MPRCLHHQISTATPRGEGGADPQTLRAYFDIARGDNVSLAPDDEIPAAS